MRAQRSRKIYRSYARSPEYFDGIAGVQIGPGATLFTRTPSAVHARESECVKMLIALWLEEKSSHWSTSFGRKPLLPAVQEPSLSRERFSENSRFHDLTSISTAFIKSPHDQRADYRQRTRY